VKIDIIKILTIVYPLILDLVVNKVPRSKANLYLDASKKCDIALDSLQELAIKYKTEEEGEVKTLDGKNLKLGIDIAEKTIEAYKERLEAIRRISE
jgi:hypothetical protein